jgi:hypothetical protein
VTDLAKMAGCFLGSLIWAKSIQRWAPHTPTWLWIAVIPSILLGLLGGYFVLKARFPQLFR